MKTLEYNALFLLLFIVAMLITVQARATEDIKVAWDFRDNSYKTIEFIKGEKYKIKVYTTAEDVTNKVFIRNVEGEYIFAIKEQK